MKHYNKGTNNMTNIDTAAFNAAKINKEQAAYLIKQAYYTATPSGGQKLSQNELAALYKFFLPTVKNTKAKNAVEWVNLAVSRDKSRPHLTLSYSGNGSELAGTCGHRLHLAECNLQAGFYNSRGDKIDVDYNYMDYRKVIPKAACEKFYESVPTDNVKETGKGRFKRLVTELNGGFFNVNYLNDATQGKPFTVLTEPSHSSPIMLKTSYGIAVIMPVRIGLNK